MRKIVPPWLTCNADWNNGYAAGLREGARRERRALRTMVRAAMVKERHEYCSACYYLGEIILERLASRKRKGGK